MARVEYMSWPIATALCGSVNDVGRGVPGTRLEARLRLDGVDVDAEMRGLLGNWRLLGLCRRAGHGRAVLECGGKRWEMAEGYVSPFTRSLGHGLGLEVRELDVRLKLGGQTEAWELDVAMFQELSGIVWTNCRFTLALSVTMLDEGEDLFAPLARGTLFRWCDDMVFRDCEFTVDVSQGQPVVAKREEEPWELIPIEGGGGFIGGSGGGWPSDGFGWPPHEAEPYEESYDLEHGSVGIGFRECNGLTFFGGRCRVNAFDSIGVATANATAVGLLACGSGGCTGLTCEAGTRVLGDRLGWRSRNGMERAGMDIRCQSEAIGEPGDNSMLDYVAARSFAIGMEECRMTPCFMEAEAVANAHVDGDSGRAVAGAVCFEKVAARQRSEGVECLAQAGAHGADTYTVEKERWQCEGL